MAALRALELLDTPREERFDRITRTAQRLLHAPIALITLVDVERQWFKSCQGLGISETPRSVSFCAHAIAADDILVVPDAHLDPLFVDNPLVTGPPYIRFYAGKPVRSPSGHRMGTLCVIDTEPRTGLSDDEAAALTDLAAWAELEFSVVTMSRAVAERDEMRARVEQIKDEIISVTGHELRTPLTGIRGSLGLLAAGVAGSLPDEARRMVDTAVRNTDRLIRLVNDMLDVERLAAGRMPMKSERVELGVVVDTVVDALAPVAVAAHVAVEVHVQPSSVVGDKDRLVQVLSNLVDNAIKFSAPDGVVTVTVSGEGDTAVMSVRDQGSGIPADQLVTIFDRFAQLDSGSARARAGSGLGLAIVRGIVEAHSGSVSVESSPGEGSTFAVRLPRADDEK
jgi:signal transduction histidine kinase